MAGILTGADLAAIAAAVAAANAQIPPPIINVAPAPAPTVNIAAAPPRDFAAEQNLKDQRHVLQKLLHSYDGTRKVKMLRRWLEVQENYLRTFVPSTVNNPNPPPATIPGVWPQDLPRVMLMSHLKTQVEKGAQTLHDKLEVEVDPITNAFTVNTFADYQARFVANFLPTTVRNEVEMNLKGLRFMGSMNQLVEDVREQIEEITAASELSNGVQPTLSNLELAQYFQEMFKKSTHPDADKMLTEIAGFRTSNPNSGIDAIIERAVAYWGTLGHTDDAASKPRTTARRDDALIIQPRGRGTLRGRGDARFYRPYAGAIICHRCGGLGHRANQCPTNPGTAIPTYTRGQRGSYRRGQGSTRGTGIGRGGTPAAATQPQQSATTQQTPTQTATRGQSSSRRGFPFGPRYKQPYRSNMYYANQYYDVNYQEFDEGYGYDGYGYGYDRYDPYMVNEQFVDYEQQYEEEEMPDAAGPSNAGLAEGGSADLTYQDFQ